MNFLLDLEGKNLRTSSVKVSVCKSRTAALRESGKLFPQIYLSQFTNVGRNTTSSGHKGTPRKRRVFLKGNKHGKNATHLQSPEQRSRGSLL